jgi:hypothetical protein
MPDCKNFRRKIAGTASAKGIARPDNFARLGAGRRNGAGSA